VGGLKVERRGDAAERAVAPRATNGVVVGGGMRLAGAVDFDFGDVVAIDLDWYTMMSYSESLQQVLTHNSSHSKLTSVHM